MIKKKFLPSIIAVAGKFCMRLILRTCKIEVQGLTTFISTAENFPCIIALWHEHLAIIPEILSKNASQFIYTAFISNSRDGEPLARLVKSYSIGRTLRVPHNSRGQALKQLIDRLNARSSVMIITPDGPKGPSRVAKPGLHFAAEQTGAKIVFFSWVSNRSWRLKTWDKMWIPKPFSKITVSFDPFQGGSSYVSHN